MLFGPPGSGKGTQAKLLQVCLKVPHISTGDMLRQGIRIGGRAEADVKATMLAGSLVSDEIVNSLVEERISDPDCSGGFILDGYPRTRAQAEYLCKLLRNRQMGEVVIHFIVDYNVIIARLSGRRQCPRCGALYNLVSSPPKRDEVCDLDGTALIIRDDDRESVIRERLESYDSQTKPLVEYFKETGRRVFEVDGSVDPPEIVFEKVCRSIDG
jgi:adenylate kinase